MLLKRPTLGQVFALALAAVALIVGGAFALFLRSAKASILESSDRLRVAAARHVEANVVRELGRAERALENVERGIRSGAIGVNDPAALEADLFTQVLGDAHL